MRLFVRARPTTFMFACCVLGLALAGCDDSKGRAGLGDRLDGGGLFDDAALGGDGSMSGAGNGGSGNGSSGTIDGAVDGGDDDDGGAPHEIDPTEDCEVAEDFAKFEHLADYPNEGGFSLTTGPAGFGVAFQAVTGGGSIYTMAIDAAGKFPSPKQNFAADGARFSDVSLLWTVGGWQLGWIDNFVSGMGQVHTIALNDKLQPASSAKRTTLTDNTFAKSRPVLADIAGVPMLAWIADNAGKDRRISGKRLDASSEVIDYVGKSTGHKPINLALTQVGEANAALAWVEEEAPRGVWLQQIDASGEPTNDPLLMSDASSAGSSVDLATRDEDGGGAIYSVTVGISNREVRFRRLDATGAFMGQDVKIISAPLQATGASLARLGGGYVVAYRALVGGSIKEEDVGIRFTFISKEGNPSLDSRGRLISYPVAPANGNGGRTTVRVSLDGQILIAYLDAEIGKPAKLHLVRQRLDCAQ